MGKRLRSVETKTASALRENNSRGENPRRLASQIVTAMSVPVMAKFGHALSAHCPDHVSCHWFENGSR